jgi:predicted nucleic acid-binding protein
MSHDTALLDANVLYPAPLRDVFLQLAVTDIFKAKWSAGIHREWMEALLRNEPERDRVALERTRDLMDQATRDSLVTGYEPLIPALSLPDPDDRHVLAAAIVGRCDVIVTQNLKDFPETALAPFHLEAQHPDEFLCNHLSLAPGVFCSAVRKVRARLVNPPYSVEAYLATLTRQGLVATAGELESFAELL